jgi:predicted RNA binding protein YcfA (HicA-like mRNA interferase family)
VQADGRNHPASPTRRAIGLAGGIVGRSRWVRWHHNARARPARFAAANHGGGSGTFRRRRSSSSNSYPFRQRSYPSSKLKCPRDVSGGEAVKALERLGFSSIRQTGSHVRMAQGNRRVTIPLHRNLVVDTLQSIVRQAGVFAGRFPERPINSVRLVSNLAAFERLSSKARPGGKTARVAPSDTKSQFVERIGSWQTPSCTWN